MSRFAFALRALARSRAGLATPCFTRLASASRDFSSRDFALRARRRFTTSAIFAGLGAGKGGTLRQSRDVVVVVRPVGEQRAFEELERRAVENIGGREFVAHQVRCLRELAR